MKALPCASSKSQYRDNRPHTPILLLTIVNLIAAAATPGYATLTQGDLSIYGTMRTRWSGRWGEGGAKNNGTPTAFIAGSALPGTAAAESGGSFDFNRWDLVQAR